MSRAAASSAVFLALLLVGAALDLRARRGPAGATATRALSAAMRSTPGRVMVFGCWIWLGVHFLAR
jgi:hypothetical protein